MHACSNANRQGLLPESFLLNMIEYAVTPVQLYTYYGTVGSEFLIVIDAGTHPIFTFFFCQ